MFVASWLFSRQWMNQRGGFTAYWPGARIIGVSLVACYVCFGLYRFFEVPLEDELVPNSSAVYQVPIDTSSPRGLPGETEANAKSTSVYRSIAKTMIPQVARGSETGRSPQFHRIDKTSIKWADLSEVTQQWVARNRPQLDEIVRLIDAGGFYFDSNLDEGMEIDSSSLEIGMSSLNRPSLLWRTLPASDAVGIRRREAAVNLWGLAEFC